MGIEIPNFDWKDINEENEEANAWLYIPGEKEPLVNLPVVQGTDNTYYLSHNIYGEEDKQGALFIDWRNNPMDSGTQELSDVTSIYGHNMISNTMLAPISNYKKPKFYERYPYGFIIAENGEVYKLDFFAGVIVKGNDESNVYTNDFIDESQFKAHFDNIISNSTFESNCEVQYGDKIVALSTCSYELNNSRYVLYGVLTRQIINDQEVQSTLGKKTEKR